MDKQPINININNINAQANSTNSDSEKKSEKKFRIQHVIIPMAVALIGAAGVILAAQNPGNDKTENTDVINCKKLKDSLMIVVEKLEYIKSTRTTYNYDDSLIDSIKLEQNIYEINNELKKKKCE